MDPITLIATVPAIVALVNLGKKLGLTGNSSAVLAVCLGVVINVANTTFADSNTYQSAIQGLILGLSAAGLYDVTKSAPSEPVAKKTAKRSTK